MRPLLKFITLASVMSLAGCGQGRPYLQTLGLNKEGNDSITAEAYPDAMQKYIEALRFDPFIGQLHLNLGLSFEGQEQADKALQSYKEAEKLALSEKNFPLAFMARFNQGQLLGKAKRVDEALVAYQSALEIIPSSQETKTNIELLIQDQQGGGEGEGEQNKDPNQQQGDNKQDKPQDGDDKKDQEQEDKKDYGESPKYKPRPFKGELSEGDVKKILGELKQQEEKIRAEYNRKDSKEQPRDKDW